MELEASYNSELTGSPGRVFKSSDSCNRQLPTGTSQAYDADDGLSTVLTIGPGDTKFIGRRNSKYCFNLQC